MRTALHALPLIALVACVEVDGGDVRTPGKPDPVDKGGCTADATPTDVNRSMTIDSDDDPDFADVPDGCWQLWGTLRIESSRVTTLSKLKNLSNVTSLEIEDSGLTRIDVPITVDVYDEVLIRNNVRLTDISGVNFRDPDDQVARDLDITITDNPLLGDLGRLDYVREIARGLRIQNNAKLAAVELRDLDRVGAQGVTISTNAELVSIDLGQLASVGKLIVQTNAKLTTLGGVTATSIPGDVTISGNRALTQLSGMTALATVGGAVALDDNDALVSLDGLASLRAMATLSVSNNAALASLAQLNHATVTGNVTLLGNSALDWCKPHEIDHCATTGPVTLPTAPAQYDCPCWCRTN